MANLIMWPNWKYFNFNITNSIVTINGLSIVVFTINKARTKALNRIGPHNKKILDIILSGMLSDFEADEIPGNSLNNIRFNIKQSITHTAYIHYLTLLFYNLCYCSRPFIRVWSKPYKKGEICSLMVADLICMDFGWIQFPDGKESACIVMKPRKTRTAISCVIRPLLKITKQ